MATAPTFIPIRNNARLNFNLSQFKSLIVVPPAIPNICDCIAALAAVKHTSWLLTTTPGAEAVEGVRSTVVVPDTVLDVLVTVLLCAQAFTHKKTAMTAVNKKYD